MNAVRGPAGNVPDRIERTDQVIAATKKWLEEAVSGLQVASFHPLYQFAGTRADDVENYTNRSPYPMLHLLREVSVARAAASFPDIDGIGARNIETLRRLGHEGWRQLWIA